MSAEGTEGAASYDWAREEAWRCPRSLPSSRLPCAGTPELRSWGLSQGIQAAFPFQRQGPTSFPLGSFEALED